MAKAAGKMRKRRHGGSENNRRLAAAKSGIAALRWRQQRMSGAGGCGISGGKIAAARGGEATRLAAAAAEACHAGENISPAMAKTAAAL